MAQQRTLYEDGRPYTVPESLEELTGPTTGVVELPQHLDWSEQGRYDLSDPRQRNLMYERVIRESMRVEDLRLPRRPDPGPGVAAALVAAQGQIPVGIPIPPADGGRIGLRPPSAAHPRSPRSA